MALNLNNKAKRETLTLVVVFLLVLAASGLVVYFLTNRSATNSQRASTSRTQTLPNGEAAPSEPPATVPAATPSIIDKILGSTTTRSTPIEETEYVGNIFLRLLLAALLGTALAFRPRKRSLALKRNPSVAQTQILLAIVASALMIIVGDNAARAFGIFAAVSLVRFRTNIRDPKEITVLLICLAIGLATGVARWDLALILAFFALVVLWLLEVREPEQVFRSMNLKVATRNVPATQSFLSELFRRYGFGSELRTVDLSSEAEQLGTVVYCVDVTANANVDQITEQILALDQANVDSVEWAQNKSLSYVYQ
jgi:hypothetical protein